MLDWVAPASGPVDSAFSSPNDALVLGFVEPGHCAHRPAQDRAGKQVAVALNMRLGQRQAHAVPEGDQRECRILGPGDLGQLPDIGGHVLPGTQSGLPEVVGTGRFAMPTQVGGTHDEAPVAARKRAKRS